MAKGCLFGARPDFQQFLALAAATLLLLLLSMPVTGAAEQQRSSMIIGNTSLCSTIDVDGEDGDCALAIAQAQPELEGFEMAADLGIGVVRLAMTSYKPRTEGSGGRGPPACGRVKDGPYYPCTTPSNVNAVKCHMFERDCP
ncbi:hypothetical protein CRG98_047109 [Punica granatum]|uniref:Uncharacterized protein n=1 Tax=Punica granatum TaxID=22663 RepID=A0A2I0HLG5_PUNGR|nr:hypothetical protein CRG98_047109 [Punica granatum]